MKIIGHRGASGYKPENTLASFKEALALGVEMVECDVYVIKTGEVVVFHDSKLDRTTNGRGKIEEITFSELRKLDAGNGEPVPLLTEVLDLINKKAAINIELKGQGTATSVAKIITNYMQKKKWSKKLFLVSSLDHNELIGFNQLLPSISTSALFRFLPRGFWKITDKTNAISANVAARAITRRTVKAVHARGLKIFAYTVNSERQAKRMRLLKVDGIFSDYPDKVSSKV